MYIIVIYPEPMMPDYQNLKPKVLDIINDHISMPGNLLPILHSIQDKIGYVPPAAVEDIAKALYLSQAEVYGVISFYHYFRTTAPGKFTIHICRAESCQSMGSKQLENYAKHQLGIDFHETTADGQFSLEPVYCLGNCACSPSITVAKEVFGRVTPEKFDNILASYSEVEI